MSIWLFGVGMILLLILEVWFGCYMRLFFLSKLLFLKRVNVILVVFGKILYFLILLINKVSVVFFLEIVMIFFIGKIGIGVFMNLFLC